jgi:hypothetical protein
VSEQIKLLLVFGFLVAFVVLIVVLARTGNKPAPPVEAEKPTSPDVGRQPPNKRG